MLHVHRSDRADALVAALAELLAEPPPDPFAPELVAVPTRGIERWLTQQLSAHLGATPGRGDGVCANVDFPSPHALIRDAVASAAGVDPDADPWRPERAVWPLLEVVDAAIDEPWLAELARHIGRDEDPRDPAAQTRAARRLGAVRHLASLFDRYALYRPEMVRGWLAGRADDHWQAELLRRLRARIGEPGPAERTQDACAALTDDPALLDLPPRLAVFGLTRLPAAHVDVLHALAAGRDVHLLLLHPSPALWETVAERLDGPPPRRRADDPTIALTENRLLASWGRDARELQLVLARGPDGTRDHRHGRDRPASTLLARLQADVRHNRPAPAARKRPVLDPSDTSLQVHACHGRARQVEVLRDAVLHLLEEDPTLEPRDIVVMCPDIEAFAPLIHATFGPGAATGGDEDDPGPDLRVRLADRSVRQTNPVIGVVAQLLDLASARVTASQVLDLADRDPVRRRFRFDDDDVLRLESWVADSGIRWGLDADHRAPYRLDGLDHGTFRRGVDRLLLGVAMPEDPRHLFAGVLALDDVDSGSIDLAGRFAELVARLRRAIDALSRPQPVADWAEAIAHAADALTATGERDTWQRAQLQRMLDELVDEAGDADAPLQLGEVRALLADRLAGRPTRANFRTGHLTVCTLMPMRSVPHRVVCLLGLDDGVFPRHAPRDGDDLTLDNPHVGERDPRSEDRQLLLDALMAAEERLLITYTGNDERTNAPRPPAVPVGELLDVVDRTVRAEDGRPAREHVQVRHPLQPFDPANFDGERPWSFDRVALAGAVALAGPRHAPAPFLTAPLPPLEEELVDLEDLVRFVQHPVRAFLRRRLGVSLGDFSTEIDDALPVQLDALERWDVGQRMLDARLAGTDARAAYRAEIARGLLPPGRLAQVPVQELVNQVQGIFEAADAVLDGADPRSADVRAVVGATTISGTVPGVCGATLRTAIFSRVGPKHRLAAWVRLLALTASDPDTPWTAVTVGRARRGDGVTIATIPPLADDPALRRRDAERELERLLDLYRRGLREPLPIACKASAAYAEAARAGGDPRRAADGEWTSSFDFEREDAEPEHQLVHGGKAPLDALLEIPPADGEAGPGWDVSEPSRFGRLARRLWDPLRDREELEDR
ncbi:MAG TPA: exodeoxyribonuclease V subunit gamma [Capillimicrobium sp.]|nr:exodeoxyribonuclease V subunit gamma [Capillimicrobium sp.]